MPPPSKHIGIGEDRFRQAVFWFIQGRCRHNTIITKSLFDARGDDCVHAIRINGANQLRLFFVSKLTPNSYAY
jgi:hypothetical protein